MAYPLNYFYKKTKGKYRLSLLSGETGLSSLISWVYLMEDIQNTDFLRGGELVITTGMSIRSDDELLSFAKELHAHHACGLILNTGHYIKEVPDILIRYCESVQMPLFTMPWEIHIADIMENYCNEIMIQKHVDSQIQEAFEKALFHPDEEEKYIQTLYRYGYTDNTNYRILASYQPLKMNGLAFFHNEVNYYVFPQNEPVPETSDVPIGLSLVTRIGDLAIGRKHAYQALLVGNISGRLITDYNKIGLYQTVFAIPDKTTLRSLSMPLLQPLLDYDKEHGTDYMGLTRLYLELDGSVQKVAERTFTHRNTVNYRIGKIKKLLDTDFSSLEECCRYQIAFYIYDVLSVTRQHQ